jgi:hypothetical protein
VATQAVRRTTLTTRRFRATARTLSEVVRPHRSRYCPSHVGAADVDALPDRELDAIAPCSSAGDRAGGCDVHVRSIGGRGARRGALVTAVPTATFGGLRALPLSLRQCSDRARGPSGWRDR